MKICSRKQTKLLSLAVILMAVYVSCHNEDKINNNHHHETNCVRQHSLAHVPVQEQEHMRSLSSQSSHPFIIYGEFPESVSPLININAIKRMFKIATKYYKSVITVTQIPSGKSVYDSSDTCGGVTVNDTLRNVGFDQTKMDAVYFIVIQNTYKPYVAYAAACVINRWVTYGEMGINSYYLANNIAKVSKFHSNVYSIIHQMTHNLGLAHDLFQYFYSSYSSTTRLNISQVRYDNGSRSYVITPNVKAYVQSYFNCNDPTIGGLLQNDGGSGSANHHWERTVYYDELMTSSDVAAGLKISALTLNLLKDTGWYYSVDISLADPVSFGKGKGCQFASSQLSAAPEYCSSPSDQNICGFYNEFGGYCISNDTFLNSVKQVDPKSNQICTQPQGALEANADPDYAYNDKSRCFDSQLQNGSKYPYCYESHCQPDNTIVINIKKSNNNVTCLNGQSNITLADGVIYCPINNQVFCERRFCQSWCNNLGICLNGTCLSLTCQQAIEKCLSCQPNNLNRCTICANNSFLTKDRAFCRNCSTVIPRCIQCYVNTTNNDNTQCSICSTTSILSSNKQNCLLCQQQLTNCLECQRIQSSNNIKCNLCNNQSTLSNDSLSCISCSTLIQHCSDCSVNNNKTSCSRCGSSHVLSFDQLSCKVCTDLIPKCSICIPNTNNSKVQCFFCDNNYYVSINKLSCQACQVVIPNCISCENFDSLTKCQTCRNNSLISSDQLKCRSCKDLIPNCLQCYSNSSNNRVECQICENNFFVKTDKLKCLKCKEIILNCQLCSYQNKIHKCSLCSKGYLLTNDTLQCINCQGNIVNQSNNTICTVYVTTPVNKIALILGIVIPFSVIIIAISVGYLLYQKYWKQRAKNGVKNMRQQIRKNEQIDIDLNYQINQSRYQIQSIDEKDMNNRK